MCVQYKKRSHWSQSALPSVEGKICGSQCLVAINIGNRGEKNIIVFVAANLSEWQVRTLRSGKSVRGCECHKFLTPSASFLPTLT